MGYPNHSPPNGDWDNRLDRALHYAHRYRHRPHPGYVAFPEDELPGDSLNPHVPQYGGIGRTHLHGFKTLLKEVTSNQLTVKSRYNNQETPKDKPTGQARYKRSPITNRQTVLNFEFGYWNLFRI